MNIVHLPYNTCEQAKIVANSQVELGHNAISIAIRNIYNFESNRVLKYTRNKPVRYFTERIKCLYDIRDSFDVYHYHSYGLLNIGSHKMIDAKLIKKNNKRIVVEFWGSDVRLQDVEKQRNPFYINSIDRSDDFSRDLMKRWADITDGEVIFPDHTFNAFFKGYFTTVHNTRQRIDTHKYTPFYPDPQNKVPIIAHAPTHKAHKGTKYVEQAIENLKKKN